MEKHSLVANVNSNHFAFADQNSHNMNSILPENIFFSHLFTHFSDQPIHIVFPDILRETARNMQNVFPGDILYAVKCNDHPMVLQTLYEAGITSFDTASIHEIETIRTLFPEAVCRFMNPVKPALAIERAFYEFGLREFVLDHESELTKMVNIIPPAARSETLCAVRLDIPRNLAKMDLGGKFGATPEQAITLLQKINRSGMRTGLTFHVGSYCTTTAAYRRAIEVVHDVALAAGVPIDVIDVGGGFPAAYQGDEPVFSSFVAEIMEALAAFPLKSSTGQAPQLWCEPGRALVAAGQSILTQVTLRRDQDLFLNDGVFGSLSELKYLGPYFPMRVLDSQGLPREGQQAPYRLLGPTCDNVDSCPGPFYLPQNIQSGDWIEVGMIGAYSNAYRTRFNGFAAHHYVTSQAAPFWQKSRTHVQAA